MKQTEQTDGPPCQKMEALLQQVADGSLRGIRKYYTVFHAGHCYHCGSFLKRMQMLVSVMRENKENVAPDDAMARLKDKIRDLDSSTK